MSPTTTRKPKPKPVPKLKLKLKLKLKPAPAQPTRPPADTAWNEGVAARRRGDWVCAEQAFVRAADQDPSDVLAWVNLADARRRRDDAAGAAEALSQALALEPDHNVARQMAAELMAQQLMANGPVAPQLAQLDDALRQDAALLNVMARTMWTARRTVDAVSTVMLALALEPARLEAHELLMYCMRDLGLKNEAAECARTVLTLAPDRLSVRMHLLFDQRGACDWSGLDSQREQIVEALQGWPDEQPVSLPAFGLLSLELDPALQLKAARLTAAHQARQALPLPALPPGKRRPGRLRVGFLSHDFRTHPVAQLMADTVEQLDRQRCEVFLYAHGPADDSAWRERLRAGADHFVDFGDASDGAIAHRVRSDAIDVLVDLGGHTRGNRLAVLAWRPAPVQSCFLGYPGSTGAPGVDYLIGDPCTTPLAHAADFSEKLAQLQGCVLPASRHRPLPGALKRADCGLPEQALVLCAFNQAYKLLPATFDIWCEALRAQPTAVLWLKAPNADVERNLRREAQTRGVDPSRLIFAADKIDYAEHFSRLALADLFVDNWPYNAHTTASDALWAGLPVLTLRGRSFASRVAASLLQGAGLPGFACDGALAYRQRLLALVQDPSALAAARAHLQRERLNLPIFDTQAFAEDLLALFERMQARQMQGLQPDHLEATPAAGIDVPVFTAVPIAAPTAAPFAAPAGADPVRLHIGGKQAKPGWQNLNIQPGPAVDHVGDVCDLSAFADACAQQIYASHVLEHVSQTQMPATLAGLCRLLVPGGQLMVSVPDLEILSHTIISPHASTAQKFHAMRMMFGGQVDAHDFHHFGWTFEFMRQFLLKAGFSRVERIGSFGLFKDTSDFAPWGFPISLNVIATR